MEITVYRVPTGPGQSYNEFLTLLAATVYCQQQGVQGSPQAVTKTIDPPAE